MGVRGIINGDAAPRNKRRSRGYKADNESASIGGLKIGLSCYNFNGLNTGAPVDLLTIIRADGIPLTREAGTNGGELAGPCPFCGGRDRFRVWPEKGRYWCRQCKAGGDAIQYLRDKHGVGYREACAAVGVEPKKKETFHPARQKGMAAAGWLNIEWQKAAWAFLMQSRSDLQRSTGAIAYLRGRGLKDETISSLGLNASTAHVDRAAWGLPPETDAKTGKLKRLWLPRGIVIPALDGKLIHRLRIRLSPEESERTKAWTAGGKGIRYIEVSGSGAEPLLLLGKGGEAWAVVESELDAYLIYQESGDLVNVMGLGSSVIVPNDGTIKRMTGRVLVCLDHDTAGWKAVNGFWSEIGEYWPTPSGKDPGDYFQAGGNIRTWIELGLKPSEYVKAQGTKVSAPPEEETPYEAPQAAGEQVCNDIPREIESREGVNALPCRGKIRCFHLRGGQCFYRGNWGPVSGLGACPMVYGLGHGDAHPAITELERYRAERARVEHSIRTHRAGRRSMQNHA